MTTLIERLKLDAERLRNLSPIPNTKRFLTHCSARLVWKVRILTRLNCWR